MVGGADFFLDLVNNFGYLGVFLSSLIGSATVILPLPSFAFVVAAGAVLNPFAVGVLSGLGAAIGELSGYGIGFVAQRTGKKFKPLATQAGWIQRLRKWFQHKLGFLVIVVFAATPLPDDIIGIFCGLIRYDVKKFFAAALIGKTALGLFLAYSGFGFAHLLGFFAS